MKWLALLYLVGWMALLSYLALFPNATTGQLMVQCGIAGGIGGALYCLRGLYLNVSVKDQWDERWMMWYAARPVASVVMGVMVYVLIRAGLLVLEASDQESSTQYGYYAVSFLAGLNVDNFIKKFESVAGAAFGVNMSRASRPDDD
jgi:hypothetical protein